jgi:hypothetical protein
MSQMNGDALKPIRPKRTALAPLLPIGPEHEMIHRELGSSIKEVNQGFFSVRAFEYILFLKLPPWQRADLSRHRIPHPGEFILFRKK